MDNSFNNVAVALFKLFELGTYTNENIDKLIEMNGFIYRKNKSSYNVLSVFTKANKYYSTGQYGIITDSKIEYIVKRLDIDCLLKKKTYSVGDKVKIVDYPSEGSGFTICRNPLDCEMGKWLGKVMTIKDVQSRCYTMKEDNGKWAWTDKLIDKKVN